MPHARSSLITYYNIHSHMRSRGRQCGGGLHLRRAVAVCGYGDVNKKRLCIGITSRNSCIFVHSTHTRDALSEIRNLISNLD